MIAHALHPRQAASLGPACAAAILNLRDARQLPEGFDYVLAPPIGCPIKPRAFQSLAGLARRIHALRRGQTLHLADETLRSAEGASPRPVVAIYTQTLDGVRDHLIGYAWLKGARWPALADALYAAEPNPAPRAEAA